MAVSVDKVYQTVQELANKEQRGYITPKQFNLLAEQAQLNIFEEYFYDLYKNFFIPGNDTRHGDVLEILKEKISIFETSAELESIKKYVPHATAENEVILEFVDFKLPSNLYRLSSVKYSVNGASCDEVSYKEFQQMVNHPLTKPTVERPLFYKKNNGVMNIENPLVTQSGFNTTLDLKNGFTLVFSPSHESTFGSTSNISPSIWYIRKPNKPRWNYKLVNFGGSGKKQPLYLANTSVDFDLHYSEQSRLVDAIAKLSGLSIKDQSLYAGAGQEEAKKEKR